MSDHLKKFSAAVFSYAFTVFTIMPLALLVSFGLFGSCTSGLPVYLVVMLLTVLVANLPAFVGNYKVETITYGGGGTLDMYRERPEVIQKKSGHRFPLRWSVFVVMLIGVMAFSIIVPYVDAAWLNRMGFCLVLLVCSCLLVGIVANPKASFIGFTGALIGIFLYVAGGLTLFILRSMDIARLSTYMQNSMMIYIFMCVFMFNSHSMLQGYNAKGSSARPASRIARSNRLMVTVFGVVLLLVMFSTHIRNFFEWLGSKIGNAFVSFIQWIFSLIPKGVYIAPQDVEGMDVYSAGDNYMVTGPATNNDFWVESEKYLYIIGFAIAGILLLIALFKLCQGLRVVWRRLLVLLRKYAKSVSVEYEDEHESLLEWDDMRREMGDSIKARVQKILTREKKYSQMDARERVRYIIRELYRRAGENFSSKTFREATELIDMRGADVKTACELYERTRYSDKPVSNEEADELKKAVEI